MYTRTPAYGTTQHRANPIFHAQTNMYNRDCTVFDDDSVCEIQAHFKYHKFVNNNNNSSIVSKRVKSGGACLSDFSLAHCFIAIFFRHPTLISPPWVWLSRKLCVIIWILPTKHKFSIHTHTHSLLPSRAIYRHCRCAGDSDGLPFASLLKWIRTDCARNAVRCHSRYALHLRRCFFFSPPQYAVNSLCVWHICMKCLHKANGDALADGRIPTHSTNANVKNGKLSLGYPVSIRFFNS